MDGDATGVLLVLPPAAFAFAFAFAFAANIFCLCCASANCVSSEGLVNSRISNGNKLAAAARDPKERGMEAAPPSPLVVVPACDGAGAGDGVVMACTACALTDFAATLLAPAREMAGTADARADDTAEESGTATAERG